MSAARLISEFGAQDVGAFLSVFSGGVHTRVASWNNANKSWDVLPAGHELLSGEQAEPAPVVEEPPVVRRRSPKAPAAPLFPTEE